MTAEALDNRASGDELTLRPLLGSRAAQKHLQSVNNELRNSTENRHLAARAPR